MPAQAEEMRPECELLSRGFVDAFAGYATIGALQQEIVCRGRMDQ